MYPTLKNNEYYVSNKQVYDDFMTVTHPEEINVNDSQDHSVLIISNHPAEADVLYLWPILKKFGQLQYSNFVLKEEIRWGFPFGWFISMIGFLFVTRKNKVEDMKRISNYLEFKKSRKEPHCLALFPEGTDYSPEKWEKSAKYVENNEKELSQELNFNPRLNKYVLVPRTVAVQKLLQSKQFKFVIDVTTIYENNFKETNGEIDFDCQPGLKEGYLGNRKCKYYINIYEFVSDYEGDKMFTKGQIDKSLDLYKLNSEKDYKKFLYDAFTLKNKLIEQDISNKQQHNNRNDFIGIAMDLMFQNISSDFQKTEKELYFHFGPLLIGICTLIFLFFCYVSYFYVGYKILFIGFVICLYLVKKQIYIQ